MKRLILSLIMICLAFPAMAEEVLYLYNWADYTPPALVEKFEKETGIRVIEDVYENNEALIAKLQSGAGGYDVVVPSDYAVDILRKENLIQPVGINKMSNWQYVMPLFHKPFWDLENTYAAPITYGTTAFAVDTEYYDGDINTLDILFRPP